MDNIGILDAGIIALLGYAVVFFGLVLLMIVVTVMGKIFMAKDKKQAAAASDEAAAPGAALRQSDAAGKEVEFARPVGGHRGIHA